MSLKTLEEYEREKEASAPPVPVKTGVACPECGEELTDDMSRGFFIHTAEMKKFTCMKCGFGKVVRA